MKGFRPLNTLDSCDISTSIDAQGLFYMSRLKYSYTGNKYVSSTIELFQLNANEACGGPVNKKPMQVKFV